MDGTSGIISDDYNPATMIIFPKPGQYEGFEELCAYSYDIPQKLLYSAYMQGVFPWFDEDRGDPVLWQSPNERFVIFPELFHVSKSIDKFLKKSPYTYTMDKCFDEVMKQCGLMERIGQNGTWIGSMMKEAYSKFHKAGFAHSFEVWKDGRLAGGFYGILIGSVFCGESMFTIEPDSSKSAFVIFARRFFELGGKMIDCQVYTENMARYGAIEISREKFLEKEKSFLKEALKKPLQESYL